MNDVLETKVFTCKRCEYEWLQRHTVIRSAGGKKIKRIDSNEPKNCSECKSPSWKKPRG